MSNAKHSDKTQQKGRAADAIKVQDQMKTSAYLSELLLFIHKLFAAGDHLVECVQSVFEPLYGLHVLIIQFGNSVPALDEERLNDPRVELRIQNTCRGETTSNDNHHLTNMRRIKL